MPEPDLTPPPLGITQATNDPSSLEFALIFRRICRLTIEKVTADTAIMLDWRGREAATGGRSGQCAIAAARSCRRIEACSLRSEIEVYPGVDHRFAFPRRATYHRAADGHWARLLDPVNRSLTSH